MMSLLNAEERKRLGLEAAVVREVVHHEVPPTVAMGRAMPVPTPALTQGPFSLGTACDDTIEIEMIRERTRLTATDKAPLEVTSLDQTAFNEMEAEHVVAVWGRGRVLVRRPDGFVLVLRLDGGYLQTHEVSVLPGGETVPEFAPVKVDVAPYLETVREPWLRNLVSSYNTMDDPLAGVIAIGLIRRYGALTADKRAVVLAMRRGEWQEPTETWTRTAEQLDFPTIAALATAEAARLKRELGDLSDRVALGDPVWVRAWVQACHARDDLEAIAWVLPAGVLDEVLRDLDEFARRARVGIPPGIADDERLRNAALLDLDAWWVEPARDPSDFQFPGFS